MLPTKRISYDCFCYTGHFLYGVEEVTRFVNDQLN